MDVRTFVSASCAVSSCLMLQGVVISRLAEDCAPQLSLSKVRRQRLTRFVLPGGSPAIFQNPGLTAVPPRHL